MKQVLVLVVAAVALVVTGCSSGSSTPGQVMHTSHLWQTDREATLELLRERYPDEVDGTDQLAIGGIPGMYDAMIELFSDGTYILHVTVRGELFESNGTWQHTRLDSGARIRLDPNASRTHNQNLIPTIRSWSIRIDESGQHARIRSLSEVDTVLKRLD